MLLASALATLMLVSVIACSEEEEDEPGAPYAYIACQSGGMSIVSIADTADLALINTIDALADGSPLMVLDVVVKDDIAYCAAGNTGIVIVDIADLSEPRILSIFDTAGCAIALVLKDSMLYIVDTRPGLYILDVFLPDRPYQMGSFLPAEQEISNYSTFVDCVLIDSTLVVATALKGLFLFSVVDSRNPTIIGSYTNINNTFSLTTSGQHVYVACLEDGISCIDVSDPYEPTRVGGYNTNGNALDVAVRGSYAYVADGRSGLLILDIVDPTLPRAVGAYSSGSFGFGVDTDGTYAYLACATQGMRIVEVTNPASPKLAGEVQLNGSAARIARAM